MPVTLATGVRNGFALLVDTGTVYWTDRGEQVGSSYESGTVMKVSAAGGGTPVTIARGQSDPVGLALDSTYVYWVDEADLDCGDCPDGTLNRLPR